MRCPFLVRLCAFFCRCLTKGETTVKPPSDNAPPLPRTARPIQPTLVVYWPKLKPIDDSPEAVAQALGQLNGWNELSEQFGGTARLTPRRAIQDSEQLDALIKKATANAESAGVRGYRPMGYKHYFVMSIPSRSGPSAMDRYCDLKAGLTKLGAQVYLSMPTRPADVSNSYVAAVRPTDAVGANLLTSKTGTPVSGAGEFVVDIEKAWLMAGINANPPAASLPSRANAVESAELGDIGHGSAVAGIILGVGNNPTNPTIGGLAPSAQFVKGACLEVSGTVDPSQTLASTILDAAVFLSQNAPEGTGVILIEQETWERLPIESLPLEFAAIQTAAAAGHIVVQPAGNGGQDLNSVSGLWFDGTTQPDGTATLAARSLDPMQGGPTSGAITVAAGCSGIDPAAGLLGVRSAESNYGNLVDCWAWGDSIATVSVTKDQWGQPFTFPDPVGFGGTSGASAIIAGAVLLMLQLSREAQQPRLNAGRLRDLLQGLDVNGVNGVNGLQVGTSGVGDLAGKFMPDLALLKPALEPVVVP